MWLRVTEVDRFIGHGTSFRSAFLIAGYKQFAVQVKPESLRVLAGVAVVDSNSELVLSGRRRGQGAAPSHGVVIALQARHRNHLVPVEVDAAVGAGKHRCALEILVAE